MEHKELEIIEDTQALLEQMRLDDIEENPSSEVELFECSCCESDKPKAGSMMYSLDLIFCNECALLSEIAFALGKITDINEFLDQMEDTKLADLCEYIKQQDNRLNN